MPCPSCGTPNGETAKFCQECGASLAVEEEARRRLVTALFCDLVGSTELAEGIDPERLRKLFDRYHGAMQGAIERHGGTVEKFIGDAVVGTFGIPVAHEDDTLRALRAALEMREASAAIDLPVRIAINVGEAIADEAAAREGRIAGDVFNTAARLQAAAAAGEILVADPAERMLRGQVVLEPVTPVLAKGKAEPVAAFRVVGIRSSPTRAETPLVGRARALTRLVDALDDAIEASAAVMVSIMSAPGVGKSRLAEAFVEEVRARATTLIAQTPSYGDGVTFAPLVELLTQAAGAPSGDAQAVADALRHRLAAEPDGAPVGDRLAQILGVGEALAGDTAWAVRRLFEVLAAERPLVIVLEDVHWAEPPMLDLVDWVVERLHGPALVLCLARPELLEQRPTWGAGKPRALSTTLPPLPDGDARELARILLGEEAPAPLVDRVCDTAEGNPLYLEQLTAMLVDDGLLADGRWTGPTDEMVEIPPTLQALLAARFDGLAPSTRRLLERASVEGRRFRTGALRALVPDVTVDDLESAIASLDQRGFVQPEDEATGRWRFAHSLMREAAYRGLSKALRADLHERLADWIAVEDADRPDVDESVARHLERALHLREELGEHDERSAELAHRAGELFADAGTRAFEALDLLTTRDLLGRAATLLPAESPRRLDLLPNLGVAMTETGASEETEALLTEGVELARAVGAGRDALRASIQLLSNRVYRSPTQSEIATAVEEATAAAAIFEASGDDVGLAEAAVALEYLEFMRGHVAASHGWCRTGLRHGLAAGRVREASQSAADLFNTAITGPLPFDRLPEFADGLRSAPDEPISTATRHALMAIAALAAGDEAAYVEHDRHRREVLDRNGLSWLSAAHEMSLGILVRALGRSEEAERWLRHAREVLTTSGDIWWVASIDGALCLAVAEQDQPREFLRLADAVVASTPVGDREILVLRHLVQAKALKIRGQLPDAEVAARRGIELAEPTDLMLDRAAAWLTLTEILEARDLGGEAVSARAAALALFREKGYRSALAHLGEP
ncbi:MAG TPA: adenylate/guanylate cyclase domain-containing protein [Actinomycetota bacterium]|nr:adenylate/guanylate cyclase domain-containing protein [Actinomycetota bacterium]